MLFVHNYEPQVHYGQEQRAAGSQHQIVALSGNQLVKDFLAGRDGLSGVENQHFVAKGVGKTLLQLAGHRYFGHQIKHAASLSQILPGQFDVNLGFAGGGRTPEQNGLFAFAVVLLNGFQRLLLLL